LPKFGPLINGASQVDSLTIQKSAVELKGIFSQEYLTTELYNAIGERVMLTTLQGSKKMELNISDLASGLYFIRIRGIDSEFSAKIVKK